MKSLRGQHSA